MKLTKKGLQKGCLAALGIYVLSVIVFLAVARNQIDFGSLISEPGSTAEAGTAGEQHFSLPEGADILDFWGAEDEADGRIEAVFRLTIGRGYCMIRLVRPRQLLFKNIFG